MTKKRRKASKYKIKFFFAFIIFSVITTVLGYNLFSNIVAISEMKNEKKALKNKIVTLQEEKKELETDIKRLEDSDYIAKYVREKYLYSKKGELIIRYCSQQENVLASSCMIHLRRKIKMWTFTKVKYAWYV